MTQTMTREVTLKQVAQEQAQVEKEAIIMSYQDKKLLRAAVRTKPRVADDPFHRLTPAETASVNTIKKIRDAQRAETQTAKVHTPIPMHALLNKESSFLQKLGAHRATHEAFYFFLEQGAEYRWQDLEETLMYADDKLAALRTYIRDEPLIGELHQRFFFTQGNRHSLYTEQVECDLLLDALASAGMRMKPKRR